MKKKLLAALACVALLGVALVVNALRLSPAPHRKAQAPLADGVDAATIAAHLAASLRFQTVSHQNAAEDDQAALAGFRDWMVATYPKTHAALTREVVNGAALVYRWQGSDPSLEPLLFLAHQDVVPVEPGTEAKWTHPPWDGVVADGFVWGRGAMDDKGSLVCLLEAVESLLAQGFAPKRTVVLAFGFDEEVGGHGGAEQLAALFEREKLRFAWALDEGSAVTQGIVPGLTRPMAAIAVTEKGYLTLELVAETRGGHSSMPPAQTAVGVLSAAIARLEADPFPPSMPPFLQENFEVLAPEVGFGQRVALANLWLTKPVVVRALAKEPVTSPLVRTTTAPTVLEAGVKENVLPSRARGLVNFRILPGESIDSVVTRVRDVVHDERVTVSRLERTMSEPAPVASSTGPGFRLLAETSRAAFDDVLVGPSLVTGATDARHYARVVKDAYRFVPRVFTKDDLPRVHGTDERADVQGLATTVRAYRTLLSDGAVPVGHD